MVRVRVATEQSCKYMTVDVFQRTFLSSLIKSHNTKWKTIHCPGISKNVSLDKSEVTNVCLLEIHVIIAVKRLEQTRDRLKREILEEKMMNSLTELVFEWDEGITIGAGDAAKIDQS